MTATACIPKRYAIRFAITRKVGLGELPDPDVFEMYLHRGTAVHLKGYNSTPVYPEFLLHLVNRADAIQFQDDAVSLSRHSVLVPSVPLQPRQDFRRGLHQDLPAA